MEVWGLELDKFFTYIPRHFLISPSGLKLFRNVKDSVNNQKQELSTSYILKANPTIKQSEAAASGSRCFRWENSGIEVYRVNNLQHIQ